MQIKDSDLSTEIRRMKILRPDIYNNFFNRIYNDDRRFHNWRLPLFHAAHTVAYVRENLSETHRRELTDNYMLDFQIAAKMQSHNNPLFFVENDLLKACLATSTIRDIDIESLKMPFEAMTFVLPRGAFTEANGDEVRFLAVMRDRIGEHAVATGDGRMINITSGDTGLVISTMFPTQFATLSLRINQAWINRIEELETKKEWRDAIYEENEGHMRETLTEKETGMGNLMVRLVVNLILALEARPELLTRERKIKQTRRERHAEFWTPNVIGRSYRIQVDKDSSVAPGSHASPSTHWRRGHFRRQGIGAKNTRCVECGCFKAMHAAQGGYCERADCACFAYVEPENKFSDYKTIWLEPVLVNAIKETA